MRRGGGSGRVQVRQGPRGLELRVHGTHASHRRPGTLSAGPVWDALGVALLALPESRRRRIAVLGLGAGSAARIYRALAPQAEIVGVELAAEVVAAARAHFDLDALRLEVVVADSLSWLRSERRRFDLVVEDCFVGPTRTIRKPPGFPEPALRLAARRLARGGLLVVNTIHEAPAVRRSLRSLHLRVLEIAVRGYWNRVLVAGRSIPDPRSVRRAACGTPLQASLSRLAFRSS